MDSCRTYHLVVLRMIGGNALGDDAKFKPDIDDVFFMLVFMAVVSTYVTTPILRRLVRSSEVEQDYMDSEFARRVELPKPGETLAPARSA